MARWITLGKVWITLGALKALGTDLPKLEGLLERHRLCDWGDAPEAEKQKNEEAVLAGGSVMSGYKVGVGTVILVMTKPDRDITVVALPEEKHDT